MIAYHLLTRDEPLTEADYAKGADRKEKTKRAEYLIDENGVAKARVVADPVSMKFAAPKTQVMGIIINGLLEQKLNWALVLIGAFLAIALELCGVSSLAFAVGVYVPMSVSAPIFFGGMLRWGVDAWMARKTKGGTHLSEAEEIAKTETSSGVLLASGFIAGGSLAGVLGAFIQLPFFESIKKAINFGRPPFKPEDDPEPYYSWMAEASRKTFGDLDYLALIVFGLLALFLVLVGMGKLLPSKPEEKGIPR